MAFPAAGAHRAIRRGFVCKRNKLIFEIDGDSQYSDEGIERDIARTEYLRRLGYSVLRFTNDRVLSNDESLSSCHAAL